MDLEVKAAKARIRAERRCGELLMEMEKAKGGEQYHRSAVSTSAESVPTLSDMGLTKDFSSESQKLAQVPEDEFEEKLNQPGAAPSVRSILPKKTPPATTIEMLRMNNPRVRDLPKDQQKPFTKWLEYMPRPVDDPTEPQIEWDWYYEYCYAAWIKQYKNLH